MLYVYVYYTQCIKHLGTFYMLKQLIHCKINMLSRHTVNRIFPLVRRPIPTGFSSSAGSQDGVSKQAAIKEYKFYDGFYSEKLKLLRRISITSSFISVFGLPVVISLSTGDMSVAAKISIAATAVVASVGSTAILHAITHPYITTLSYVKGPACEVDNEAGNYRFKAIRMNLFGNPRPSEFSLNDMEMVRVTNHPYANFQVNGKYYYLRHEVIENELLREKISARCTQKSG